jgi:hypothetical protein
MTKQIRDFHAILVSKLIQADMRAMRKGRSNPYALALWLRAAAEACDSASDLVQLKANLKRGFTSDFSPAKFVIARIDAEMAKLA